MNVYEYVAESNPQLAERVMNSFNYDVINSPDMGLSQLVDKVGEPALRAVMENHPDKDIILEMFSVSEEPKSESCGCNACRNKNRNNEDHLNYLNASGNGAVNSSSPASSTDNNSTHLIANQTNVILIASAMFIAVALILKNK